MASTIARILASVPEAALNRGAVGTGNGNTTDDAVATDDADATASAGDADDGNTVTTELFVSHVSLPDGAYVAGVVLA